jgi:hypothetical protein
MSNYLSFCAAVLSCFSALFLASNQARAGIIPFPNDDPLALSLFTNEIPTLNPATGEYLFAGPIIAVQLNGLISPQDSLVTNNGSFRFEGQFTGQNVSDPEGIFRNVTNEILVGGRVVYRETVDKLVFGGIVTLIEETEIELTKTEHSFWLGKSIATLHDDPAIDSPFLDQLFLQNPVDVDPGAMLICTTVTIIDQSGAIKGTVTRYSVVSIPFIIGDPDEMIPEPSTLALLGLGTLGLLGYAWRRRKRAT